MEQIGKQPFLLNCIKWVREGSDATHCASLPHMAWYKHHSFTWRIWQQCCIESFSGFWCYGYGTTRDNTNEQFLTIHITQQYFKNNKEWGIKSFSAFDVMDMVQWKTICCNEQQWATMRIWNNIKQWDIWEQYNTIQYDATTNYRVTYLVRTGETAQTPSQSSRDY